MKTGRRSCSATEIRFHPFQFVGTLNAVLFSPDDMMFLQAPGAWRRFLDTELVKLSSAYTEALRSCQKLLKERNALLKRRQFDQLLLDTYTDGLIAQQQTVIQQRQRFVMHLNRKLKKLYPVFSKGEETLEIQYKTFADPEKDTVRQMRTIYEKNLDRDRRFGATGDGIHKDDLVFLLDGYPMPAVSSQGQKRSALLALKLALCAIIKEKPVSIRCSCWMMCSANWIRTAGRNLLTCFRKICRYL